MDSSFGTRLRTQRERRQIALSDIAEQTKIRLALLEGLERDDVRFWPSGIFRRSYIRSYAQAIGLDPEDVVREFLERYPDPEEDLTVAFGDATTTAGAPPTRFRFLLGSAMGVLPGRRAPAAATPQPVQSVRDLERHISFAPPLETANDDGAAIVDDGERPVIEAATEIAVSEIERSGPESARPPVAPPPVGPPAFAPAPAPVQRDLSLLASLCTRLATAREPQALTPILSDAAGAIGAIGVILWLWDMRGAVLRPVLSHGYPHEMLAQVGGVHADADNAIAAAFRSVSARVVPGGPAQTGAVVVPLATPCGCAGVLALELRQGYHADDDAATWATILAAQLSTLVGEAPSEMRAAAAV